jgi:4-aminobutyrate aminotransferase-like enzyme
MGEPAVELVNVTNEEIIALNRDFTLFPWSAQKALNPIPIDRAEGVYLWDAEGKRCRGHARDGICHYGRGRVVVLG